MKLTILGPIVILALTFANFEAAEDAPHRIEISAKRYAFSPDEFTVKKGETVTVALTDEDFSHGIRFEEPNVTLLGMKGQTKEVTFTPTTVGDFVAQCSTFCGTGHGGMQLTMHVTE